MLRYYNFVEQISCTVNPFNGEKIQFDIGVPQTTTTIGTGNMKSYVFATVTYFAKI
jgi:hypothetical protein